MINLGKKYGNTDDDLIFQYLCSPNMDNVVLINLLLDKIS